MPVARLRFDPTAHLYKGDNVFPMENPRYNHVPPLMFDCDDCVSNFNVIDNLCRGEHFQFTLLGNEADAK